MNSYVRREWEPSIWIKVTTYIDVSDELDGFSVFAEILRLDVPKNGHSMATSQACIESICRETACPKTLSFRWPNHPRSIFHVLLFYARILLLPAL